MEVKNDGWKMMGRHLNFRIINDKKSQLFTNKCIFFVKSVIFSPAAKGTQK